jgi:hypothetical protein
MFEFFFSLHRCITIVLYGTIQAGVRTPEARDSDCVGKKASKKKD